MVLSGSSAMSSQLKTAVHFFMCTTDDKLILIVRMTFILAKSTKQNVNLPVVGFLFSQQGWMHHSSLWLQISDIANCSNAKVVLWSDFVMVFCI